MRKAVSFALFLIAGAWSLAAQPRFSVESTSFIPQSFYVGDKVEMRIVLAAAPGVKLVPIVKPKTPSWGVIHDIRVNPAGKKYEIRILFTAFRPGTQTFSSVKIGDILLDDLKVHVGSLIDEGVRDFAPPRGQILLPSTRLLLGLVVGGFIALPLLGIFLFFWVRPRFYRFLSFYQDKKPYKELQRTLKNLEQQADSLDARGFYIRLLENVKTYLSHRGNRVCAALTTREMQAFVAERFGKVAGVDELLGILLFGDEVKFGGRKAPKKKRLSDLMSLVRVTQEIEKQETHRADL